MDLDITIPKVLFAKVYVLVGTIPSNPYINLLMFSINWDPMGLTAFLDNERDQPPGLNHQVPA